MKTAMLLTALGNILLQVVMASAHPQLDMQSTPSTLGACQDGACVHSPRVKEAPKRFYIDSCDTALNLSMRQDLISQIMKNYSR